MSIHPGLARPGSAIPLGGWKVQNFKSIKEAELSFSPLTLLVGANSCGKTSLIQSILLFAQAAQGGQQGSAFPFNGPLASVGGFEEVRFAHSKGGSIGLGGSVRLLPEVPRPVASRAMLERTVAQASADISRAPTVKWWTTFDGPAVNEPGSVEVASVEVDAEGGEEILEPGRARWTLFASRRGQGPIEADAERLRLGSLAIPTREDFSLGFTGQLSAGEQGETPIRGLMLRGGLPHNVVTTWRLADAAARVWVESRVIRPFWSASRGVGIEARTLRALRESQEADEATIDRWAAVAAQEISEWNRLRDTEPVTLPSFLAQARHPLRPQERFALRDRPLELVEAIRGKLDMAEEVFAPPERPLPGWLNDVMSEVNRFFSRRVVYLGPLRQDPQVVYKTAPVGAAGFIGTKGEYLATLLHASRAREVLSFTPDGRPEPMSLVDAVNKWATRLEIADSIQTRDLGRLGIQVSVQRGGIPAVDLTSVGVGVSQLLPVVVMCLLTEPGSLVLLEQPELHLHPALQQKLADFLLGCARSGRQLIVETHSEYVASRLRRRIAEDESGDLLEAVALYFVEQKNDASEFRRVAVNQYGGVEEWPAGFFDQAATESRKILEAGLGKRSRIRGEASADVSS